MYQCEQLVSKALEPTGRRDCLTLHPAEQVGLVHTHALFLQQISKQLP